MKSKRSIYLITMLAVLFVGLLIIKTYNSGKEDIRDTRDSGKEHMRVTSSRREEAKEVEEDLKEEPGEVNPHTYINPRGTTLETRINTPEGYTRTSADPDSFMAFTRALELKEDGSPVLLYNGNKKRIQSAQVAIFAFDVGTKDLQQCADSIIRVYSEYYWSIGQYENIKFHLTNGFLMDYESWRDGKGIKVEGNDVYWTESRPYDDSYESFRKYLTNVMIYAGTLSLDEESQTIDLKDVKAGDMLLKGGSPGHCVLVVDTAQDENGNLCYLLAQGYMPAQDFHVLKNPKRDECPWYFVEDLKGIIETPEYRFDETHIKRWNNGFN